MEKTKIYMSCVLGLLATAAQKYAMIVIFTAVAVILDWLTGVIKVQVTGEGLNSKKAHKGFWKKISLFVALFFGFFLDYFIPYAAANVGVEIGSKAIFGMVVGCYIVINESISIAENLYAANPNILPHWLKNMLSDVKKKIDKEDTENENS